MANKTASRRASQRPPAAQRGGKRAQEKIWALTVKVDDGLYDRLLKFGAAQRRTNQDVLEQALKEYLTRAGA
jgi:hypothetical protein